MTPNHDQLAHATRCFVTLVQGRMLALQQQRDKLPRNRDVRDLQRKAINTDKITVRFAERLAAKLGTKVIKAEIDYGLNELEIELANGWFLKRVKNDTMRQVIAKHTGPESEASRAPTRDAICSQLDTLGRMILPTGLTTWRTYVRAQWSPNSRTDLITPTLLDELYRNYLAARMPQACAI